MSKQIQEFYERIAEKKIRQKPQYTVVKLLEMTKPFSPDRNEVIGSLITESGKMLDIGAGEGKLLRAHTHRFRSLYGIDISSKRIQHLQKDPAFKQVKLSVQNVEEGTHFRSNFFDTVTLSAVLEHVFDPHAALDEIYRILRPGGELILEVPNIGWLYPRISLAFGHFPITSTDPGFDGGHLHYFEIHNLTRLLKHHGFAIETITCSGFFSVWRHVWPSLLGGDLILRVVKGRARTKKST
jgi:2-polyprenyl-3-methyl-5-hydroxy-6-metoxy-1,4-benzoquinol methylase